MKSNGLGRFFLILWLFLSFSASTLEFDSVPVYRFEKDERCITIYNFQKHRKDIFANAKDKSLEVVGRHMLSEFLLTAQRECVNREVFFLLATYIPGVDNYGRPNFSSKVNILSITGRAKKIPEIKSVLEDDPLDGADKIISKLVSMQLLEVDKFEI